MTKRLVLASWVTDLQANLAARLFDAGFLELFADKDPQQGPDADHLPHVPIAEFKLKSPAFSEASYGEIRLYPVKAAVVTASGRITWGRAFSANRTPLMDLGVGLHEQTGNLVLDKLDVRIGQELVMLSWVHRVAASTEGY
jgi:hypothetical protein